MGHCIYHNCGCNFIRDTIEMPDLLLDGEIYPYQSFENFPSFLLDIMCNTVEPDFVNPNSYENITQVIHNIGFKAGIKKYSGPRKWVFIECDGAPYNTLRDVLDNMWHCNK